MIFYLVYNRLYCPQPSLEFCCKLTLYLYSGSLKIPYLFKICLVNCVHVQSSAVRGMNGM